MYKTNEIYCTINYLLSLHDCKALSARQKPLAESLREACYMLGCREGMNEDAQQSFLHAHHELGEALATKFDANTCDALMAIKQYL